MSVVTKAAEGLALSVPVQSCLEKQRLFRTQKQ